MRHLHFSTLRVVAILAVGLTTYLVMARGGGLLTPSVDATSQGIKLRKHSETGVFGVSIWQSSAVTQQPAPESGWRQRREPRPVPQDEATKQPATDSGATRTMLPDGTVEIVYSDGTTHRYHPNGSVTTILPDGTKKHTKPWQTVNAPVLTPPLSLLSQPDLRPWLENHNNNLLRIIDGLFTAGKKDKAIANLKKAEQRMSLYEQIDFRAGAIESLRR